MTSPRSPGPLERLLGPSVGRWVLFSGLFLVEGGAMFLLDVVIAATLGLGTGSDVLYAAWTLPQILGRGVFQSLTNSLMGYFATRNASAAYNEGITVVTLLAVPLAAVMSATSGLWLALVVPGLSADARASAAALARVLAFIVAFAAIAEATRAVYYRSGRPRVPSVARLVGTAISAALLVVAGRRQDVMLAAWGLTAGAAAEAAVGLVGLRPLLGHRLRALLPARAELRQMGAIIGAPLGGQLIGMAATLAQQALASTLAPGSVTALSYANRIVFSLERFVFGGLVISTIQSHEGPRAPGAEPAGKRPLVLAALLSFPIAAVLASLAVPLVTTLFGRGRFGADDIRHVAEMLRAFAPAIPAMALTRVPFGRAYALQRGGVVLGYFVATSIGIVGVSALLVALGADVRAFGLGYAAGVWLAFALLYRTILLPEWRATWRWVGVARMAAVGLACWAGLMLAARLAEAVTPPGAVRALSALVLGGIGCALSLAGAAFLLRVGGIAGLRPRAPEGTA